MAIPWYTKSAIAQAWNMLNVKLNKTSGPAPLVVELEQTINMAQWHFNYMKTDVVVLTFDVFVDWSKNAKFCTRKH